MISGNCNRSPQYNAMGPPGGGQRYNPHGFMQQQQQQQPHLLFMTGGSVRTFPQMSRGFSMMSNRGGMGSHPTVVQCNMQQGFGNSFGYHANAVPMFHQQHHHLYQQPQVIHHQHQQQHQHQQKQQQHHHHPQHHYVPQQYIGPPPTASHNEPTSGFINGIKNMVKGIINPLNCDFYSDHHKYYNPKYRNNYMLDIKADNLSYNPPPHRPTQPECHVKSVVVGLEINKPTSKIEEKKPNESKECTKNTPEVVAIFNSEDFPELPAPRRSRSATPAKTEITPSKPCQAADKEEKEEAQSRKHPPPKGTFFEIICTATPSGRRPTFGGRLKVVPPPFSLNKFPRYCQGSNTSTATTTTTTSTNNNHDCDIDEDSFVIFSNNDKPGDCMFRTFTRPPRQRQISECSDDSFVVFCTEDAEYLGGLQCVQDDNDDDDDLDDLTDSDEETSSEEEEEDSSDDDDDVDEDEEEDDDDGIDVVDSSFLGRQNKTDRNKCDNGSTAALLCSQLIQCVDVVPKEQKFDSGFDEKKVTFDPKPVVHVMHAWNYAYRAARKGHWEDFARDRTRFQKRIERTSVYLNPVLTPEHREKIYRTRFCDDDAAATNQQECPNLKLDIGSLICQPTTSNRNDNNQKLPKLTKLPDCASF